MGFRCAVEEVKPPILNSKVAPAGFLSWLHAVVKEDLRGDGEDVWGPPGKERRDRVGVERNVAVVEVNTAIPSNRNAAQNGTCKAQGFLTVLPAHAWVLSDKIDIVFYRRTIYDNDDLAGFGRSIQGRHQTPHRPGEQIGRCAFGYDDTDAVGPVCAQGPRSWTVSECTQLDRPKDAENELTPDLHVLSQHDAFEAEA